MITQATLAFILSVVFGTQASNYMCTPIQQESNIVLSSTKHHADGTAEPTVVQHFYGNQEVIPVPEWQDVEIKTR